MSFLFFVFFNLTNDKVKGGCGILGKRALTVTLAVT